MPDVTPPNTRPAARASGSYPGGRDEIMTRAELKRITHALETFGPMRRESLMHACGARHWHTGEFNKALRTGIREGTLRELSFGFIAAAQQRPRGPVDPHPPTSATPCSGPARVTVPEGVREAFPVLVMLVAIAVPVALLALSTLGDAALLLALAVAAMVIVAATLVRTVNRLTAEPADEERGARAERKHRLGTHVTRRPHRDRLGEGAGACSKDQEATTRRDHKGLTSSR